MDEKMLESVLNIGANLTSGGVLLLILYFLYHNVPVWINQHFTVVREMATTHKEELKEINDRFSEELREERKGCREDNDRMAVIVERSNEAHLKATAAMTESLSQHHLYVVQKMTELEHQRRKHESDSHPTPRMS